VQRYGVVGVLIVLCTIESRSSLLAQAHPSGPRKRDLGLRSTDDAFGLAISRSRVQILLEAMLRNNLWQVVYTYVPLLPSSITWYRPKGGDALRLGR